jgi:hypothetical protein
MTRLASAFSFALRGRVFDGVTTSAYGTDRCVITVDLHGENTILGLIDAARHFNPFPETRIDRGSPGDLVRRICGRT